MAKRYTDKQKTAQTQRIAAFKATLDRRKGTEAKQKTAWELSAKLTRESANRFAAATKHRENMDRQCHACGSAFADGALVFRALGGPKGPPIPIGLLCEPCRNVISTVAPDSVGDLVEAEPVAEEDKQPEGNDA